MKITLAVYPNDDGSIMLQNTHFSLLIEQSKLMIRESLSNIGFIDIHVTKESDKRRILITVIDAAGASQSAIFEGVFEMDQIMQFGMNLLHTFYKG
jgi:hypothetical protein